MVISNKKILWRRFYVLIEEDGYSYLVFNIEKEVFNKFKEDLSRESFSEIVGIEIFKIPKNNKITER